MQHGHAEGPLDGELELPVLQQSLEHLRQAELLPDPLEDQRRTDVHSRLRRDAFLACGADHSDVLGEPGTGTEHGIELPAFTQPIESPKRRDHTLLDAITDAFVVNDLQVLVPSGLFNAREHGIVSVAARPLRTLRIIAIHQAQSSGIATYLSGLPKHL